MGIDHVAILLDSPTKVFFPGQTVTGKLSVCVTGEIATLNGWYRNRSWLIQMSRALFYRMELWGW